MTALLPANAARKLAREFYHRKVNEDLVKVVAKIEEAAREGRYEIYLPKAKLFNFFELESCLKELGYEIKNDDMNNLIVKW